jgi:hypothetical protein
MSEAHVARRLEKALADDERTNELGVRIQATDERVIAVGEVASEERRQAVLSVLREHDPGRTVTDQITISAEALDRPAGHEAMQAHPHEPTQT